MTFDQKIIQEIEGELTSEINIRKDEIIDYLKVRLNQDYYSFARFNGLFGGKNNTYVDSVRTQFRDFNDFYSKWLKGLNDDYLERKSLLRNVDNHNSILLKDKKLESFVRIFLERNFYRNLKERTRAKPNEQLWAIWFGYNLIFGLLIAPKYNGEEWVNDKSEIRRVNYKYWTIGHIVKERLVVTSSDKTFEVRNSQHLQDIYSMIFKQLSTSKYEQRIIEKYIEYLDKSENNLDEPFMIPELRYDGLAKKHKYRIDFTILNSHTMEYVGFEISPASSHMSVGNLKEKQKIVNEELSEKWGKEMKKRNDYFSGFGISIVTFTDEMLLDVDKCWIEIEKILAKRPTIETTIEYELTRIASL